MSAKVTPGNLSENKWLLHLVVAAYAWKRPRLWKQKKQALNPSLAPLTNPTTSGKVNSPLGFPRVVLVVE